MRTNHTKAKLASGETVFGTFVRYPDAALVDFLGYQGWDFLVFDGEHGTLEPAACEHMVRAAELHDVTPLVRIPWNQQHIALRFLDLGVMGLQVPWVHTAEDAASAVRYVKYQPEGVRGLAGVRAADYNQRGSMAEYIAKANHETMVIAQVESEQAVRNIHQIVKTPGADVIFIGPADLSNSFGVPGDLKCPKMQDVFKRIVDAVTGSDKALGIMVGNVGMAREWQERGARYILTTTEAMLGPACKEYLRNVRPTTV